MKKVLILMLIVILISGCGPSTSSDEETLIGTCPPDCNSGNKALDISITYPGEDANVYSRYPFVPQINIYDVGEIGTDGIVLISGLDEEVFSSLGGCHALDFYITQEDTHSDNFKETKVEFTQSSVNTEENYEEFLSVVTRYGYTNYGIMDLCLTDDPAAETECNADSKKNKLSKSSAGPLQVNKITQEIIPVGGDTISLVLNIEADVSLSDNQQLMPIEDITETSCLYINDDLTIKINADVILFGERFYCDYLEFEYGENSAEMQCSIENIDLRSLVGGHKEQSGWVELKYGIEEKQSVKFNVNA